MAPITYRIPYSLLTGYFDEGELSNRSYRLADGIFSLLRKEPLWVMCALLAGLYVAIVLTIRFIAELLVVTLLRLLSWLIHQDLPHNIAIFPLKPQDTLATTTIVILLVLLWLFLLLRFRGNLPFQMRDLINDPVAVRENRERNKHAKGLDHTKIRLLALLKNDRDPSSFKKLFFGHRGSFSEAMKSVRAWKINGVALISQDDKYVPWEFTITGSPVDAKKKQRMEQSLGRLWELYLDMEYDRLVLIKKTRPEGVHGNH